MSHYLQMEQLGIFFFIGIFPISKEIHYFSGLGSVRFFSLKKLSYTYIRLGSIKLIKSDSKDLYVVTKYLYFK